LTSTHLATVDQLRVLEAEAVHIIREVAAELERPVLLFSGGNDSIVLLRLAEKALAPVALPFPSWTSGTTSRWRSSSSPRSTSRTSAK
jgi:sulfate adenylyltransferase subunit 2